MLEQDLTQLKQNKISKNAYRPANLALGNHLHAHQRKQTSYKYSI